MRFLLLAVPMSGCSLFPLFNGDDPVPGAWLFWHDADGDGYGDPTSSPTWVVAGETVPKGMVRDTRDCDDREAKVLPGHGCSCADVAMVDGTGYPSVSDAVDDAANGSIVYVCPGTWQENIHTRTSNLRIEAWNADATTTVLHGNDTHRIVSGREVSLELVQLTLRDGFHKYDGGAVQINGPGSLTLKDMVLQDNESGYQGGAVSVSSLWDAPFQMTVQDSVFEGNFADYEGGAITIGFWSSVFLDVTGGAFRDNESGYSGGAISIGTTDEATATATLTDVVFEDNFSDYEGGAISIGSWGPGSLSLSLCTLHRNSSKSAGAVSTASWNRIVTDSDDTDWGDGVDDNRPTDIDGNGSFGAHETFSCTSNDNDSDC